jgi:hypothetical protein
MKRVIVFISVLFTLTYCDPVQELEIFNKSRDTVFFELSHNPLLEVYPIQKENDGDTLWAKMNVSMPNQSIKLPLIGKNGWRNFINKRCIDGTLTIFFFDDDLLKNVPKDSLLVNQLYTKKYHYKVRDLEKLHWRINYP